MSYNIPNKSQLLSSVYSQQHNNNSSLSAINDENLNSSLLPIPAPPQLLNSSLTQQSEVYRGIRVENNHQFTDYNQLLTNNQLNLNPKQSQANYSESHYNPAEDKITLQTHLIPSSASYPPCPPGGFLEPNFHFYVSSDALDTLQQLVSLLRDASVD